MNNSLPKIALLVLFAVLGMVFSSSADAARRAAGTVVIVTTTPKPLSPH